MAWPKSFHPAGLIEKLKQKIASLQQQWRSTRAENERLRKENEQLRQEQGRLRGERERLREENERLKRQLEEAQRANKRQAAPFSRGQRKANPRPPGRKPGAAYGPALRQDHSQASRRSDRGAHPESLFLRGQGRSRERAVRVPGHRRLSNGS